jgi:hypothetical protein
VRSLPFSETKISNRRSFDELDDLANLATRAAAALGSGYKVV